jgi:hypothetical protein
VREGKDGEEPALIAEACPTERANGAKDPQRVAQPRETPRPEASGGPKGLSSQISTARRGA